MPMASPLAGKCPGQEADPGAFVCCQVPCPILMHDGGGDEDDDVMVVPMVIATATVTVVLE